MKLISVIAIGLMLSGSCFADFQVTTLQPGQQSDPIITSKMELVQFKCADTSAAPAAVACNPNLPKCEYYADYSTIHVGGQEAAVIYGGLIEKAAKCDSYEAAGITCGKFLGTNPNYN